MRPYVCVSQPLAFHRSRSSSSLAKPCTGVTTFTCNWVEARRASRSMRSSVVTSKSVVAASADAMCNASKPRRPKRSNTRALDTTTGDAFTSTFASRTNVMTRCARSASGVWPTSKRRYSELTSSARPASISAASSSTASASLRIFATERSSNGRFSALVFR